jgi:iron complex outermembrane receptor protein
LLLCTTATLATAWGTQAAAAQDTASTEDIVVTAQRRSELLEEVPMAVSVLKAQALENAGVTNINDIGKVAPGVQFNYAGAVPVVAIRGLSSLFTGNNVEPNVATYVDGFYNPNPISIVGDLGLIENIQVLKGPQGTLYGRNASGGAILVNTLGPSETFTGRVNFTYGSFDDMIGNAYFAGPIADGVRFSIAGHARRNDGYIKLIDPNTIGRTIGDAAPYKDRSLRVKLEIDLAENLTATLGYNNAYNRDDRVQMFSVFDHISPAIPAPPGRPTRFGQAAYNYEAYQISKSQEGTLKLAYETPIGMLTSYTSYADRPSRQGFDFDGSYADLTYTTTEFRSHTFQQAVDFNITSIDNVDLVVGGFYYRDYFGTPDDDGIAVYRTGKVRASTSHPKQWTRAWALFADATYHLSERFSLAAGLRYNRDRKRMTFDSTTPAGTFVVAPVEDSKSWEKLTPRVTARYELAPGANVWASWSRGFRAGTYNFSGPVAGIGLKPVDPETVDSFEVGIKLSRGALYLESSAFYYDFKGIQTSVTVPNPACPPGTTCNFLVATQNAKGARVYGWDTSLTLRPTDGLTLRGGVVLLNGRYKSFPNATGTGVDATNTLNVSSQTQDWTGKMMVRAPNISGNAGLDYETAFASGKLAFSTNVNFTSSFPLQNASLYGPLAPPGLQNKQRLRQKKYALVSAQITWTDPSEQYSISVFGNNLTDHTYFVFYNAGPFGDYSPKAEPRAYGVRVGYQF